ncbi:type VII secretion protein EccCb [Micromonospora sp. NPDC049903]|uniref:type VII secretion protein EccCb n=1 Tax=Micromonospora sp. NPDC049903 TaxID=3364276 RepID=UPI0037A7CB58
MSRVAFHRPARHILPALPTDRIVLPVPPEVPDASTGSHAWNLVLPLISSVGMAAYMVSFGQPATIILGSVFFFSSIAAVVFLFLGQRRTRGVTARKQRRRYRSHLRLVRDQARQSANAQRAASALANPEPARLWSIGVGGHRVWERRRDDADFLQVRLGRGTVRLTTPIELDAKIDPLTDYDWESQEAAERLVERLGVVPEQPMVVDIGRAGVISLLGPPPATAEVARALLCQVSVFHAPDDVLVAVEAGGDDQWQWAKWLPHTIDPELRGEAGELSLVGESPAALTDYLEAELRRRLDQQGNRRPTTGGPTLPRLILVFTSFDPFSEWGRGELMAALLAGAGLHLGITLVFLVERESDEPSRVNLRLRCGADGRLITEGRAELVVTPATDCHVDQVSLSMAELVARTLAPLRLSDEREQVLARTVSLTEMVLGGDPMNSEITSRWIGAGDPRLLRAPIGTDGDGHPLVLDIKESAQGGSGPHGLIVGATGSGKSELLRTLVTGLALTHPPELLSFVLIDFKGGAAFAPLTGLPHVAGLITNLADDAAMIDRVLAALMGEQQRRQRMLRDAGNIDSVREYQSRRAEGAVGTDGRPLDPLPYLLIVVDEFGELLSGRPDFAELFVQIGRVGRSLGMHLLMATQRLEEGRLRGLDSHLSYRICLRTFSASESRTVIGTTDAYNLPPIPGSAYLKVDESIYQRFRVAHVSAGYVSPEERERVRGAKPRNAVAQFPLRGISRMTEEELDEPPPAAERGGQTELGIVVDRLTSVISPVHQVWLPPLPKALALDHLLGPVAHHPGRGYSAKHWPMTGSLSVPIGLLDLPLKQEQETLMMDFGGAHGNIAIVGAPQTGRSTLLRTLMLAGMLTHSPDEMQFYCVDFGGGTLHTMAEAPHVGSVAGRSDRDLVSRMIVEVRSLISEREQLLRSLGLDSIADLRDLRRAGKLPEGVRAADVFLFVDNWGALRTEFDWADPVINEIAARGLGVGVHLIITTGRWNDIRPALRDSIGTRIELRLNDPAESEVNRRLAARVPAKVPGRGLSLPGVYFQLVLPRMDGQDSIDGLRAAQQDVLGKIAAGWSGPPAPPVRLLPARIDAAEVPAPPDAAPTAVPLGIGESDLKPVTIDLIRDDPHFLVFGDAGSGKSSALRTWLAALCARQSAWDARVVLLDTRLSLLDAVPPDHLAAYAGDPDTASAYVQQVVAKLTERLPPAGISPQRLRQRDWWEGPDIYVVADDYDLLPTGSAAPLAPLSRFLPQARDIGLHLVLARRVSGMARAMADPLLNRVKEMGCSGLILSGDSREGVVLGNERAAARPPGRGSLVERAQPGRLIQVALPPPVPETPEQDEPDTTPA